MADTVPPKKPGTRRRRNKPPVPPRTFPSTLKPGAIPTLPERPNEQWTDYAREYWELIWSSPVAVTYLPVDVPGLVRLTALAERAIAGALGSQAMGEMRQLEDRFGLSVLARRRLQIEIVDEGDAKAVETPKDDGRWLRAVGEDG